MESTASEALNSGCETRQAIQLADLPREVLSHILSFWDSSYLVITLWHCGDRILNSKIASGVHYVDLIHYELLLSQYPLVLSELTQLRYLSLKSPYIIMGNGLKWSDQLMKLPRALGTLLIDSADFVSSILNTTDVSDRDPASIRPDPSATPFRELFPQLHTLGLPGSIERFLPELPSTLTSLTVPAIHSSGDRLTVSLLPRTLRSLDAVVSVLFSPSTIEAVKSEWSSALPELEFIKALEWTGCDADLTWIPRTLRRGRVDLFRDLPQDTSLDAIKTRLDTLPPSLEMLNVLWQPIKMFRAEDVASALPRSLKTVNIKKFANGQSFKRLPPSLTSLTLSIATVWDLTQLGPAGSLEPLFPSTLRLLHLQLHVERDPVVQVLELLPKTLESLSLGVISEQYAGTMLDVDVLPPALTFLKLDLVRFHRLRGTWPTRLSTLHIVNTACLCHLDSDTPLPSKITSLQLYISDSLFKLTDTLYPYLTHISLQEWHVQESSTTLPLSLTRLAVTKLKLAMDDPHLRSNFFATLPSSLRDLTLLNVVGADDPSPSSFSSLRSVTKLQVDFSVIFPSQVLHHLPRRMRELSLRLDRFDDELDLPHVPAGLKLQNLLSQPVKDLFKAPLGKSLLFSGM